ncbi:hypothetical protein M3Y98_00830000 [Aphelenchoides besseyi]|nr:hypothetical protein M3Y98_00830000 [Aphelenchoides besseyi]
MTFLGIVIVVLIKTWTELERYAHEEQILEKRSENEKVTLNYCRYESATPWVSNLCGESCGRMSTAWRRFRLDPKETDISCVSRMEQIECAVPLEANGAKKTCLRELRTVIPECSGTYQHYLKGLGAIDNAWPKLVIVSSSKEHATVRWPQAFMYCNVIQEKTWGDMHNCTQIDQDCEWEH